MAYHDGVEAQLIDKDEPFIFLNTEFVQSYIDTTKELLQNMADENGMTLEGALPLPDIVVEKVQRPNRLTIEDIPLGDILSYNHVERDDIMSVLEDLIYDTPLSDLRARYPTFEDLVWNIVRGDE